MMTNWAMTVLMARNLDTKHYIFLNYVQWLSVITHFAQGYRTESRITKRHFVETWQSFCVTYV